MSDIILDCRNLQCPQPVMKLKRLMDDEHPEALTVLVDNEPAVENISRFLGARGYDTAFMREDGQWRIKGARDEHKPEVVETAKAAYKAPEEAKMLVMITTPVLGAGDDSLGEKLMKNFISTLPELGDTLWRIVMLNGGVKLAAETSPVLDDLIRLENAGVSVLVCGTCLDFFGLTAKKAVGQTTNMLDIVTSMQLADKIVRI